MARATHIYQAMRGSTVVGMFTVKHEAVKAIHQSADFYVNYAHHILRWPDGPARDIHPHRADWDTVAKALGPFKPPFYYVPEDEDDES